MKTSILNTLVDDLWYEVWEGVGIDDKDNFARVCRKLIRKAIRDDEKYKTEIT